jgi:hypothetical protein
MPIPDFLIETLELLPARKLAIDDGTVRGHKWLLSLSALS